MRIFTVLILSLLSACSSTVQKNKFSVLSVERAGVDGAEGAFCSAFKLSITESQKYFNQAKIISFKQLHDDYSFLPCFVTGKGQLAELECSWEIRAGGTGEIICGEKVYLYGCANCQEILR